ncbi:phosphoadenosine phosphosulfate reductase family protein [Metabacillus litoralis]|uniref:phosphoadenosine phosphosulfate reductase domain-containing protein n=1 Tax=Metabacillus TaxID=2675233 RepID=UPI001B9F68F6|nr:phosphoadenosine phosphosulfate reductase family protein [Metabacillus litoralis]MCM3164739.1 phosphoadenosine phosphosulfate reductase family protein [Metabacillus litoralis]
MNIDKLTEYAKSLIVPLPDEMKPFGDYRIHCNFSGGRDSIACVLLLLYGYGVPKEQIEMVHFRVDGKQEAFFDWKETDEYLEYCQDILGLPMVILNPDKSLKERIIDRGKWPSGATQYCTSYQKRDTYSKWVRSLGAGNYLCVSGERAQESPRRANKPNFQVYKTANAPTKGRYVDWLRPIHHLMKDQVMKLNELAGIKPHPCYQYVSRCSCKFCIFLSPNEMKKVSELYPDDFNELIRMEKEMGHTLKWEKKNPLSLVDFIKKAEGSDKQLSFDLPCFFE